MYTEAFDKVGSIDDEISELRDKVMELKNDPDYLKRVKTGISLAKDDYFVGGLDNSDYLMYELLESVKNYKKCSLMTININCISSEEKNILIEILKDLNLPLNNITYEAAYEYAKINKMFDKRRKI